MLKLFFVAVLIGAGLFFLIMMIDLIMGTDPHGLVGKVLNPFRVMETAEYFIVIFFVLYFIISSIKSYLNKKLNKNQPSN